MQELFPFATGIVIGLLVQRLRSHRRRAVVLVSLCVLIGLIASYVSGELAVSWGFLSFDMALVWLGALASVGLSALWRRGTPDLR